MGCTIWSKHTGEAVELACLTPEELGIGPDDASFSLTPIYRQIDSPSTPPVPPVPVLDPTPGMNWADLSGA
jgi:hypothetical protein